MQFFVQRGGWAREPNSPRPTGVLVGDNWDDYTFKTSFNLFLFLPGGETVRVGSTKILQLGQGSGVTPLPAVFENLPSSYISLGQDHDYYESLRRLEQDVYEPVLNALRDIVFIPSLRASAQHEHGYRTSLLRFSQAQAALETAPDLFAEGPAERDIEPVTLRVSTSVGGPPFEIAFEWQGNPALPGRIAAVIGYNGTGKTQLLANLAFIAADTGVTAEQAPPAQTRGEITLNTMGTFSGVIAVSYSAFDTFALPALSASSTRRLASTGSNFGYTYVGLRRPPTAEVAAREFESTSSPQREFELKSPRHLVDDFRAVMERALAKDRTEGLVEALTILMQEPSFARAGLDQDSFATVDGAVELFQSLSTGHKIVLNVIVNLVAQLQPRMLVLIDEPESHLHPPLVAALLSAVTTALDRFESLAIVATHSPVVIQEIPGRHVRILQRFGSSTNVEELDVESFAESVGRLTRTVFNLDSSATDFQDRLRELAREYSSEQIDEMFEFGLSLQGRALLATFRAAIEADEDS